MARTELVERFRLQVTVNVLFDGLLVGGMTFPIEPPPTRPKRTQKPRLRRSSES